MYDYDGNLHFLAQHERRRYSPVALVCSVCSGDICEGDWYWEPFGKVMCAECLDEIKFVAEASGAEN